MATRFWPRGPAGPVVRERLRRAFRQGTPGLAVTGVPRNARIYNAGDAADRVFLVDSGRVKLLTLSPAGKECLLGFHTPGDVFGELALGGAGVRRLETAVALEPTRLRSLPAPRLLARLRREGLLEDLLQELVGRIARQQQIITHLVTVDCERRLAETLLMLARTLGRPDPGDTRIDSRISHEELSQMVGTTRPRITEFMKKFRSLGLIDVTRERHLIVRQSRLAAHLASPG